MMHIFIVSMLSAAEEKPKGGSARLPNRSISRSSEQGLASSVSHDDLQTALLEKVAKMKPTEGDLEDTFSTPTAESSFAEPLTDEQRRDHGVDSGSGLFKNKQREYLIALADDTRGTVQQSQCSINEKELASDIKILEPALTKIFARLPADKIAFRDNITAVHLLKVLQVINPMIPEQTLAAEILKLRQKQSQRRCCVIL
ncbi:MAG: hypothetical protein ACHQVS_03715 [Candidatus Babeliales bacterium]